MHFLTIFFYEYYSIIWYICFHFIAHNKDQPRMKLAFDHTSEKEKSSESLSLLPAKLTGQNWANSEKDPDRKKSKYFQSLFDKIKGATMSTMTLLVTISSARNWVKFELCIQTTSDYFFC